MLLRILFCFFLTTHLPALDFNEEGNFCVSDGQPLFISLGGNCERALALRALGLRKAAFPFDWMVSDSHAGFLKILDEDFIFFTDEKCFKLYEGVPAFENLYYSLRFPHDFNLDHPEEEQWHRFKIKYERRIDRFRQLREYPGKIFFVKTFWTQAYQGAKGEFHENTKLAQELKDALDRYFPFLNFTLVIVSYGDLNIPAMLDIKGVVEFKVERSHEAFQAVVNALF